MDGTPRLSIVVTSYNRRPLLRRCLNSLLAQNTEYIYEIVVVDDGSTDGTDMDMVGSDDRVRYHRLDRNHGAPAHPRNVGVGLSRAEVILVFDSDDTLLSHGVQTFVRTFESNPRLGLAWSWKNVLDSTGRLLEIEQRDRLTREPPLPLALTYAPGANGLAVRREVFRAIGGFDESMPRMDDYEFSLRFLLSGSFELAVIPLITMNVHSDGNDHVSASSRRTLRAHLHVLRKHRRTFEMYPAQYSNHLFHVALLRLDVDDDGLGFAADVLHSVWCSPRKMRRVLTLWRAIPWARQLLRRPTVDSTGSAIKRNLSGA